MQRDKAFFDQKRREAAEAENDRISKEQEAMNSMTEEERAEYLTARDRAREHEHRKNRMLTQQMAGYGATGVKAVARGGRGRGTVRGGKQRASVPVLPSEHIVSLEEGGEERNAEDDGYDDAYFDDLAESGELLSRHVPMSRSPVVSAVPAPPAIPSGTLSAVSSPPSGAPSVSEPFITPVTSAAAPVDISTAAAVARSFSFLDPRLLGMVQHAVAALYDKHAQDVREVRQKVEADKQRGLDAMDTLCSQKDAALQVALRSVDGKDARIRELEGELAEAKKTHVSAAAAVKKVSEAEARAVAAEHAQKAAESKRHQAEAALADVQAMLASERLAHRAELEKAATERTASESKLSQVAIKAEAAAAELRALLAKAQDGLKAMTDAKVELENRVASMATDMALVTQTAAEMEDKLRMQVIEARALADAAQARGDALQTKLSSLALKRRSGTLLKRGGRWKAWRERHFVLVGQALVYHEGDVVKGCIVLLPSSTIAPLDDADSAADGAGVQFQIVSTASHKTYLMKAHSEAERKEWLDTLNDVIHQLSVVAQLAV